MSAAEVEAGEKAAFLAWRRGLAQVEEQDRILLTPFEKNLEVWRQLWRVLERSHIVVQVRHTPLRPIPGEPQAYGKLGFELGLGEGTLDQSLCRCREVGLYLLCNLEAIRGSERGRH